ncbi:vascular endothelial growth factor A [Takifugu rubripes]|uniref:vascular endothelial growth factor A n=1 Tax=Takifugu rubripes TaxID=31033 RepID=UPI0005D24846|nr:vascular endothelial growth factor A-like [Takifugu rubripes]XP_056915036.1 vascular endothelial growth factor A [Takifugu flavidus]|eukprot:XP_003962510.2 PREDICTED: vascular endothelial growth factor A-like [Takifugu rubripes]
MSASGATITQVSVCKMRVAFVVQTTAALLLLLLSPAQSLPLTDGNGTAEVLMFEEVYSRSFCRTIEKLVEVVQEYPTEVEHIYSPSCVPLVRCAGCCGDEKLECHPTTTTNVTMQLLKIRPSEPVKEYVQMTFVEHQTCECRVKKPSVVERRRQRGRGRKRKEKQKMKECDRCQIPRR